MSSQFGQNIPRYPIQVYMNVCVCVFLCVCCDLVCVCIFWLGNKTTKTYCNEPIDFSILRNFHIAFVMVLSLNLSLGMVLGFFLPL